jgi:hypothetical protein
MSIYYRTYIKMPDGSFLDGTLQATKDQANALSAFESLVNRTELDGELMYAALTANNSHVAMHRFDKEPGHINNLRGRLDEIDWLDLPMSCRNQEA